MDYAPILDRLFPLYPSLFDQEEEVRIRRGYRKVGHIAHGWYMRVHRGAQALIVLDNAGYSEEATGIRRAMIEHVVALRWLASEGDRIEDPLALGHGWHTEKLREAIVSAGWTSISPRELDEVLESVKADSRDPSNNNMLIFVQRAKKFGDVHTIPGYLAECARFHPSYQSAIPYVDVTTGSMLAAPRDTIPQVPFATSELLDALIAFREVLDPAPWEETLSDLIREFRQVTDRVREQDGLAPVDWDTVGTQPPMR